MHGVRLVMPGGRAEARRVRGEKAGAGAQNRRDKIKMGLSHLDAESSFFAPRGVLAVLSVIAALAAITGKNGERNST